MKDNWADKQFAEDWDTVTSQGNPTRPEQLEIVTAIICDAYKTGKLVLDIGCGSGRVEEIIFKKYPEAQIIGIDSSEPMLAIATERLKSYKNFSTIKKDIPNLELSDLPTGDCDIVFSVQVLHELNVKLRQNLFAKIHSLLPSGGIFLVMDRVKIDLDFFEAAYKPMWERLETRAAYKTAKDFSGYKAMLKDKQDDPGSIEEYSKLFQENGFKFTLLHVNFDRAVMVGIKA